MHALMFVVLTGCYFSTAFYPDAERIIWMRSRNSELAYTIYFFSFAETTRKFIIAELSIR